MARATRPPRATWPPRLPPASLFVALVAAAAAAACGPDTSPAAIGDGGGGGGPASSDAGRPNDPSDAADTGSDPSCGPRAATVVARFDGVFGGDTLMVGDGTIMSWSTDHYTSPIQGSEIWYPWCLVGASLALCASSSPFSVYVIGGGGPSKRALASALPMAGTVSRGVVYAFDRTLWLTGADGQLTASGVTLPVDWARTGGGDYNAAEKGALAPLASLATDRLVWVGRDNAVRETDMTTGVSSVLATPAVPVTAVVNSGALTAWRTGPTITIAARSRAAVTESAGSGDKPSLAAHGDGVAWIDGRAVRAVSVDGRRSSHCLGSAVVALAADGGHLYALTSEGNVHRVELR